MLFFANGAATAALAHLVNSESSKIKDSLIGKSYSCGDGCKEYRLGSREVARAPTGREFGDFVEYKDISKIDLVQYKLGAGLPDSLNRRLRICAA